MTHLAPEGRFRVVLRWTIGALFVLYGFAKLNDAQFTVLDSELDRPMGEVAGFWLTWYYFGYSAVYGSLIALVEVAGGLLLTLRRWWLAGALVLLPIIGNIALVDVFYGVDLGATVVAFLLLAGLVVLVAPHASRLLDVVRTGEGDGDRGGRVGGWTARTAIVALAFAVTWWAANVNNRRPTAIDGVWDVVAAEGALADVDRVFFERNRAFMAVLRDTAGSYTQRHFEVDEAGGVRVWADWLSRGELLLEGTMEDDGTVRLAAADGTGGMTLRRLEDLEGRDARPATVPAAATGTFRSEVVPEATDPEPGGTALGRARLVKRFSGDLDGTAAGEMLTALTATEGSAVYVALERVRGTLHGRSGTFVLQHHGVMDRGAQHLELSVVPDSGTGELTGLAGTMAIRPIEGGYAYELSYTLEPGDG